MAQSKIEWTEMTWNPTTGCTKISQGCKYCYAEVMSNRLFAMGMEKYKDNFKIRMHNNALNIPYNWKKPKIVFVNSMSDLFHEEIPNHFILKAFKVMNENPQHIFQVLTKRAERLSTVANKLHWTKNIWMGVTVENSSVEHRIEYLRDINAYVKFLSLEPLIGPLPNINLSKIDWVIVGGESGNNPRPMEKKWVVDIKEQCKNSNAYFFFKQWGGKNKKKNGRAINGKYYNGMPEINTPYIFR